MPEVDLSEYTVQRLAELIGDAVRQALIDALEATPVEVGSLSSLAIEDVASAVSRAEVPVTVESLAMEAINDIKLAVELAD